MDKKQHWQTLDELEATSEYKEQASKEFQDELPVIDYMEDVSKVESTGRRDFLKMLGFSISAATVASSCKIPKKWAVPYVFDNAEGGYRNLIPGVSEYFASTHMDNSGVANILVKTREGRPVKIEGNVNGSITKGGSSAKTQASVLDLYDHTRLTAPVSPADLESTLSWESVDSNVTAKLRSLAAAGDKVVLLSNSLASPVYQAAIDGLIAKYSNIEHVSYDAISLSAMRAANEQTFGERIIPGYSFDKAKVIVGVNCDFLGTWLSPVEFAEQYGSIKVPSGENGKEMVRHYQFQSTVTITGSSADYKLPIKPSEERGVLISLHNAITSRTGGSSISGGSDIGRDMVNKAASDLLNAAGTSLVVCGSNDIESQLIVNAINIALGNYGATIDTSISYNLKAGNDEQFIAFANELKSGSVKGLITLNTNPVYDTPQGADIATAMSGLSLNVALANRVNETSQNAGTICPGRHYLEAWNILEPKTGNYCFVQPTINALFPSTRPHLETLLAWSGQSASEYDFVKDFALSTFGGGEQGWIKAVRTGLASGSGGSQRMADLGKTLGAVTGASSASTGLEIILYESVAIGDGSMGNNPFLQELADPMSRVTWDNYLAISDDLAEENGIKDWYNNKIHPTATVTANGNSITLPVIVQFGMPSNTAAIALGYGRTNAGRAGDNIGQDVYPWVSSTGNSFGYTVTGASIEFHTRPTHKLALVQVYGTLQEEYALPR